MKGMTLEERFDEKWTPEPFSGCWLWNGGIRGNGYGSLWVNRKYELAHRVSWTLFNGNIPDGMWVLHRCDTPSCVNPSHLFLGDNSDNTLDSINKGRSRHFVGQNNPKNKLRSEDVEKIRSSKESSIDLAIRYGVDRTNIWQIRSGKTWRRLC